MLEKNFLCATAAVCLSFHRTACFRVNQRIVHSPPLLYYIQGIVRPGLMLAPAPTRGGTLTATCDFGKEALQNALSTKVKLSE